MTREEAINVLDAELKERSAGYYDYLQHYGHKDKAEEAHLDALYMAISALREQEERSKGCEYCDDPHPARTCIVGNVEQVLVGTSFSDAQVWTRELKFCPMCGRRLEEV